MKYKFMMKDSIVIMFLFLKKYTNIEKKMVGFGTFNNLG